jgi:nicotinate-nucleotide adenylyltransferase
MKIGLFFGSFNPIHIGHLAIANYMVEFGPIDQLWFVVSPHNPLKKKKNLLNDYHRLDLVKLAIDDDQRFRACDIEFKLPKPSYTINTLTYIKEKYPNHTFYLIIGADNYLTLKDWKNWETLMNDYSFLVYPRPGYDHTSIELENNFEIIDAPIIEISSTFIRDSLKNGKDVRHFMPTIVANYVREMHFYEK